MIWKKKNKRTDTWRNGAFSKMDNHPVHTAPNHQPPKMMFFRKHFLNSSVPLNGYYGIQFRPPNQQQQPLPSLLSDSFSMDISIDAPPAHWTNQSMTVTWTTTSMRSADDMPSMPWPGSSSSWAQTEPIIPSIRGLPANNPCPPFVTSSERVRYTRNAVPYVPKTSYKPL